MLRKIVLIVLAISVVAAGYWWFTRTQPIPVRLVAVEKGVVESTVANTRAGTIKACQRSRLSMPVGGQVEALLVEEGERVKQGQVLIRLWNKDQAARTVDAQARFLASQKSAQEACQQAEMDQREYKRLRGLADRKLVSVNQLDTAKTRAEVAVSACDAGRATVQASQALVELQQAIYEKTELRAPFDGVVAEINGEVGEFITPSPFGVATPPAIDLIADDCLYATAPIDEVDAAKIHVGMPVRITLDAFRGQSFEGQVTRIAPYVKELEKQARTVDVDVRFTTPPDGVTLLVGYSADIEIILQRLENVLRIPTETVLQGEQVLRYQDADGVLQLLDFKPGISNWSYTQVLEGLAQGDRVLVSLDTEGAVDGAHVQPEP